MATRNTKWRKAALLLAVLWIFSAACAPSGAKEEENIAKFYQNSTFTATLSVTMDHGETTTSYRMTHAYAEENHTMVVTEPAGLAGLTIQAGEEDMTLMYQGMVFTPGELVGTGVTPVRLLPALWQSWHRGVAESVFFETEDGEDLVVLDVYAKVEGEEFLLRTWFSRETLLPKKAHVFAAGRRVMVCTYEEAAAESQTS